MFWDFHLLCCNYGWKSAIRLLFKAHLLWWLGVTVTTDQAVLIFLHLGRLADWYVSTFLIPSFNTITTILPLCFCPILWHACTCTNLCASWKWIVLKILPNEVFQQITEYWNNSVLPSTDQCRCMYKASSSVCPLANLRSSVAMTCKGVLHNSGTVVPPC